MKLSEFPAIYEGLKLACEVACSGGGPAYYGVVEADAEVPAEWLERFAEAEKGLAPFIGKVLGDYNLDYYGDECFEYGPNTPALLAIMMPPEINETVSASWVLSRAGVNDSALVDLVDEISMEAGDGELTRPLIMLED